MQPTVRTLKTAQTYEPQSDIYGVKEQHVTETFLQRSARYIFAHACVSCLNSSKPISINCKSSKGTWLIFPEQPQERLHLFVSCLSFSS